MLDIATLDTVLLPRSDSDLPVRLDRKDEDAGKKAILKGLADRSTRIASSSLAFYHKTVAEMVGVAADARLLRRQYRMTNKEIVDELTLLGVLGFGVDLKFNHEGIELRLKYYPLSTANLGKIEEAFSGLIRPMEVTQNGRVKYAPVIDEALTGALSSALLGASTDLTLDDGGIRSALVHATNSKLVTPGKCDSILRNISKYSRTIDTGKRLVFKDGKYIETDATLKEKDRARAKLADQTAELMDVLTLTQPEMETRAAEIAQKRSDSAAKNKAARSRGEAFGPVLEEFGISTPEELRALLTVAVNAGYSPETAVEEVTAPAVHN